MVLVQAVMPFTFLELSLELILATKGAGAGTESAGVETEATLIESGRDLARILALQDCNGWSSSGSDKVARESSSTLSDTTGREVVRGTWEVAWPSCLACHATKPLTVKWSVVMRQCLAKVGKPWPLA
ncbi:hypothetical protein H5410_035924 [Solanum commersonii]|uniref:Secreted protein n=1 Tax=Solanum commersonii TaxID=4109 RepID=A0A9J5Y632_SOLCO|nr:hypothetical protein H5410_035924 [Solanum commersonii]